MKQAFYLRNLILSVVVTAVLLYFAVKTPSPKVIFLPFLICGLSMAAYQLAQLLGKEQAAAIFHKLFAAGFLLFWLGFLSVAAFICIRDKEYSLLAFSVPFWLIGVFFAKRRFF